MGVINNKDIHSFISDQVKSIAKGEIKKGTDKVKKEIHKKIVDVSVLSDPCPSVFNLLKKK